MSWNKASWVQCEDVQSTYFQNQLLWVKTPVRHILLVMFLCLKTAGWMEVVLRCVFNLKMQHSWSMMIDQKLKKYLEPCSNWPEICWGFIYLLWVQQRCFKEDERCCFKADAKRVVCSMPTVKAFRRSFSSKFTHFKAQQLHNNS